MAGKIALLSIQTKYAKRIFDGTKTWEFRKSPPRLAEGEALEIVVYSSKEEKAIIGSFKAGRILRCPLAELMAATGYADDAEAVAWFASYYKGSALCSAIEIREPVRFRNPLPLQAVRARIPNFRPPQNFVYMARDSELYAYISQSEGVSEWISLN